MTDPVEFEKIAEGLREEFEKKQDDRGDKLPFLNVTACRVRVSRSMADMEGINGRSWELQCELIKRWEKLGRIISRFHAGDIVQFRDTPTSAAVRTGEVTEINYLMLARCGGHLNKIMVRVVRAKDGMVTPKSQDVFPWQRPVLLARAKDAGEILGRRINPDPRVE